MRRGKKKKSDGFELVKGSAGLLIDGIYYNEEKQILKIQSYKGTLMFRPLEEKEKSLDLKKFEL